MEFEVGFERERPRFFYTDLPAGIYMAQPEDETRAYVPMIFLPAEVARSRPEELSQALQEAELVEISVAKLKGLVEQAFDWFRQRLHRPAEEVEGMFREHCYLVVMPHHINVAMRNPAPDRIPAEVVKVKMRVDHGEVEGRRFRFGAQRPKVD
jgi:hypothetical protein